jgi:uncharacterized protein (DUF362 family)
MRRTYQYATVTYDKAHPRPSALLRAVSISNGPSALLRGMSLSNGRWTFSEAVKDFHENSMAQEPNRRAFLRTLGLSAASITLSPLVEPLFPGTPSPAGNLPIDLAVAKGPSVPGITSAAVDLLGGIKRFISKGDIVVIKPNMGWDRIPEQAANTNPHVVATLVSLCFDAGAKKVKVFDHTCDDPRRCYVQSGIAHAARKAGAEVTFIDDRKFKEMNIGGEVLKSWKIYTEVVETDKLINVPIAKHHSLAKLSMGMKNWMGAIGGWRGKLHWKLHQCLPDLASFFNPTLTILDAVRILVDHGPQGGRHEDVKSTNMVIAGVDQIAIDSFGATLFGMKGSDLAYVQEGHTRGLGRMDFENLKVKRVHVPAH